MGKNRDLNPLDPLPANQVDALNEFVGGLVSGNFELRIKAADPTTLEIPAGPGNDQVSIGIGNPGDATKMRWRYISATVSRVGLAGAARVQDVYVTATDNVFAPGSPGELDTTNYAFSLVVTEAAAAPAGPPALYRKIGTAQWDGAKFATVAPLVGRGGAANTTSVVKIIGDGTVGPFNFDHGLGTRDVIVEVYETSSPWGTVDVAVQRPTVDRVTVAPDVAIAASGAAIVVSSRGTTAGAVAPHGSAHLPGVGTDPTNLPVITTAAALAAIAAVDGQEVYFVADAAAGVKWRLRYNSALAGTSKWEVVGGGALFAIVRTSETAAGGSGVWGNLATVGPDITVPLTGDYDYELGMKAYVNNGQTQAGLAIGNTTPDTANHNAIWIYTNAATTIVQNPIVSDRWTALAAGSLLRARYNPSLGANGFYDRWMRVRPVRVG